LIAQIEPAELASWRKDAQREPPFLVDVREQWEYDYCRIEGSRLVPLATLPGALEQLPHDRDIVLVCHHGTRSFHAAAWLRQVGFERVHNLRGGVAAWAAEVDPDMKRY
jgi:rhodanese-related sulfurtransferase